MNYVLGVDFGTTFSAAAVARDGRLLQQIDKADLFADFEVPEPATGAFVLVVKQRDRVAELLLKVT